MNDDASAASNKRRHPRFVVEGVHRRMVFASRVEIINISLGGVALTADRRLNIGVEYSLRNIADHIKPLISRYSSSDRFLVYCFRGGKRSRLWADNLRTIGFEVDVLAGGWKRYRQWVRESLAALAPTLSYRVLAGPTGCGKTRLLVELARQDHQVLDLEALAVSLPISMRKTARSTYCWVPAAFTKAGTPIVRTSLRLST